MVPARHVQTLAVASARITSLTSACSALKIEHSLKMETVCVRMVTLRLVLSELCVHHHVRHARMGRELPVTQVLAWETMGRVHAIRVGQAQLLLVLSVAHFALAAIPLGERPALATPQLLTDSAIETPGITTTTSPVPRDLQDVLSAMQPDALLALWGMN